MNRVHVHVCFNLKSPNSPALYESYVPMYVLIEKHQTVLPYKIMRTYVRINLKSLNSPPFHESCVDMYVLI